MVDSITGFSSASRIKPRTRFSAGRATNAAVLLIVSVVTMFPILYLMYVSLIHPTDYNFFGIEFPLRRISLLNYRTLLAGDSKIIRGFRASVIVTALGTVGSTFMSAALAYPLSKKYLPGRIGMTAMVFFTMLFNGGLIPTYLLVRGLGMVDTIWALILPSLISPWNMFIIRNFFQGIPESLEESARIEGAHDVTILVRVVLPLSKAVIVTIGLFYMVGYWNAWFNNIIYIRNPNLQTLQVVLRNIVATSENAAAASQMGVSLDMGFSPPAEVLKMTAIVISTIPILLVYPFVQKHFIKGVLIGSIKG